LVSCFWNWWTILPMWQYSLLISISKRYGPLIHGNFLNYRPDHWSLNPFLGNQLQPLSESIDPTIDDSHWWMKHSLNSTDLTIGPLSIDHSHWLMKKTYPIWMNWPSIVGHFHC
jgi:hypothetical protein